MMAVFLMLLVGRRAGGEVVINFSRAEDEAARALGAQRVVENFLEIAVGEFNFLDTQSLRRKRLLGVMMKSGLRKERFIWRRSAWKYWAGVVRLQTWILFSAQAWR